MSHSSTKEAARGRWREILPQLGISPKALNGKPQPCPACGGKDRFRFDDRRREGDYYCSKCGAGHGLFLLCNVHGWDYAEAAKRVDEVIGNLPKKAPMEEKAPNKSDPRTLLRQLYKDSQPIADGDPVDLYLKARGIRGPYPDALRYVPEMYHADSKSNHPGMIATITDAAGKPKSLHRTFLTRDGRKANVTPNRMFMPGGVGLGGAVRLRDPVTILGIAEGIETALAAAQFHRVPVWAALNELCLRNWTPPESITHIYVFGDNDANFVGQTAAYTLAKRLVHDSFQVTVEIPQKCGTDWNDYLLVRNAIVSGMEQYAAA